MTAQVTNSEFVWKPGRNGIIDFCGSLKRLSEKEPKTAALLLGHFEEEGFQTEDSEYTYKIYHSQYGYSVGRREKPVPDMVITSMEENTLPKTPQRSEIVIDQTKFNETIVKAFTDLTYAMNSLVLATLATSEAERNITRARLSRSG